MKELAMYNQLTNQSFETYEKVQSIGRSKKATSYTNCANVGKLVSVI